MPKSLYTHTNKEGYPSPQPHPLAICMKDKFLNALEIKLVLTIRDNSKSVTEMHKYINFITKSNYCYDWIARKMRELESFGFVKVIHRNYGNCRLSLRRGNTSYYISTSEGVIKAEESLKKLSASSYSEQNRTLVDVLRIK